MKFCERPYKNMHFDPNGNVRLCSWTDMSIGNILEEEISDIWHGEKAEIVRKTIEDGSYRYCRKTSCPFLENDTLENLTDVDFNEKAKVKELPTTFNVANDFICNHSCPSCREKVFVPDKLYAEKMKKMESIILPLLNQATSISASGNGDLFASPYMMELLEKVHPVNMDCKIGLESNGALFDEAHWQRISHFANYKLNVAITPNSYVKNTHYYLSGNHESYSAVMKNLEFISQLRMQKKVDWFEISIVLQDRNFLELPDFIVQSIDKFKADIVTVKPLYKWFALSEDMYWFKDVLNPLHPYHQEYLSMMKNPIIENSKVFFWGGKNLHEPQEHPAYVYIEIADYLNLLLVTENIGEKINCIIQDQGYKNIIIYGENQLTEPMVKILLDNGIKIKSIMAKYPVKKEIEGINVLKFDDYDNLDTDTIIVMNYNKIDYIVRDFEFIGFGGQIVSIDEILYMLKEK